MRGCFLVDAMTPLCVNLSNTLGEGGVVCKTEGGVNESLISLDDEVRRIHSFCTMHSLGFERRGKRQL